MLCSERLSYLKSSVAKNKGGLRGMLRKEKERGYETTNSNAMGMRECHDTIKNGLLGGHQSFDSMKGECMVMKEDRRRKCNYKHKILSQCRMSPTKKLCKTNVEGFFIEIIKRGRLGLI